MKISDMCRFPLLGIAALLILSGCSVQKFGAPELFPTDGPYKTASVESLELTSAEKAVFERSSVLDRHLDPTMEAMVRYHFVKYSREKRVTMQHFLRNSLPYLNYAKAVFRSKGLPEELAYLAFLESGYNPLAVSRSKATGVWQFISSTGKIYGLSQDWWMDERMDPYRSTHAAADYLAHLYEIFQDWHLAVASYNGGEGAVGRAQKAAKAGELHDILRKNSELEPAVQLREETRLYVPRFLALLKIMRDPEALGLKALPPDAKHPVLLPVTEFKARPGTDLAELSRRLGLKWKDFLAYNPHFLRSVSPVNRKASVYIPKIKEEKARKLLEGTLPGIGWYQYTVKKNDTLARVSKTTGIPQSVIRQLNPGKLKRGQRLRLPAGKGSVPPFEPMVPNYEPATSAVSAQQNVTAALAELESRAVKSMPSEYEVRKGDTLSGIADKFGCSVADIQKANGGADKVKKLRAGQLIRLPSDEWKAEEARKPIVRPTHTVQKGDTLSGIAKKHGVTVKQIYAENDGSKKLNTLRIGQVIQLPYSEEQREELEKRRQQEKKRAEEARKAAEVRAKAEAEARIADAVSAGFHTVESGDTLSRIARRYGTSVSELRRVNGGPNSLKTLRIGQKVKLPGAAPSAKESVSDAAAALSELKAAHAQHAAKPAPAKTAPKARPVAKAGQPESYKVQAGDTIWAITHRFGMSAEEFKALNPSVSSSSLRVGGTVKIIRKK